MLVLSLCVALFVKGAFGADDIQFSSGQDEDSGNSVVGEGLDEQVDNLLRYNSDHKVISDSSSSIDSDVAQHSKCDKWKSEIKLCGEEEPSSCENAVVCSTNTNKELLLDPAVGSSMESPKAEEKANVSYLEALIMWDYLQYSVERLSDLDCWLNALLDILPATLRKLFTNAPLPLTPARCLLSFGALCSIVSLISTLLIYQGFNIYSDPHEKDHFSDFGFNTERALSVMEQENEDLKNEVETLRSRLHEHEERSLTSTAETAALTIERDGLHKQLKVLNDSCGEIQSVLKLQEESHVKQIREVEEKLQRSQAGASEMQSRLKSLTEELSSLQSYSKKILAESEDSNQKMQAMSEELNQLRSEQEAYEKTINFKDLELIELKKCFSDLKFLENEITSSSNIHDAKGNDETEVDNLLQTKMKDLLDVAKANVKLKAVTDECFLLKTALTVETETRFKLEEQLRETKEEVERIMESRREAEHQVNAAKVKMDVLSSYFKEKERELNRKLCVQEAHEKANADQLVNTDVRTREFEATVQLYKEKIDKLHQEIQKIEAEYRKQIAAQEKKTHECWLSARQSEREFKEQKIISQNLRQKNVELQARLDVISDELKIANELKS